MARHYMTHYVTTKRARPTSPQQNSKHSRLTGAIEGKEVDVEELDLDGDPPEVGADLESIMVYAEHLDVPEEVLPEDNSEAVDVAVFSGTLPIACPAIVRQTAVSIGCELTMYMADNKTVNQAFDNKAVYMTVNGVVIRSA
jgi:hypothetical protein